MKLDEDNDLEKKIEKARNDESCCESDDTTFIKKVDSLKIKETVTSD